MSPLSAVCAAPLAELDPVLLYRILALRTEVFVVEQHCPYLELDGRDLEPGTLLLWVADDTDVVATARLLREPGGVVRIGRVATARGARGHGHAARIVQRALELADSAAVTLDAQSYLQGWYERFGFVRVGAEFLDDGIPHVPMRRARH